MTGFIGISLGDATGIGPEVTLKALAAELPGDDTRYLILGDEPLLLASCAPTWTRSSRATSSSAGWSTGCATPSAAAAPAMPRRQRARSRA